MIMNRTCKYVSLAVAVLFLFSGLAIAGEDVKKSYCPYVGKDYPMSVYWGDTHLHTSTSGDAYGMGNFRVSQDDAYTVASGGEITSTRGMRVKLSRPLDFVVIADHSENLGIFPRLMIGDPLLNETETGKKWIELIKTGGREGVITVVGQWFQSLIQNKDFINSKKFQESVWSENTARADRHNKPGKFTALIGYEWTSSPNTDNLHRVVVFRDGADTAGNVIPFSSYDSLDPAELWKWMEGYEKESGGKVLAIPHNGNLSNGLMFAVEDFSGNPLTSEYAKTRARWEPIYEMTQYKGDAEAHPLLSPSDEFADYETWDKGNFSTKEKEDWMLQYEYARSALKLGLQLDADLGVNPFKFGFIGSTDSHTGIPTAEENNYWGKNSNNEPRPGRWKDSLFPVTSLEELGDGAGTITLYEKDMAASGLAAVWARENTRSAIFEAMQRKETYATTGPRMAVRFFGGWDFADNDAVSPDFVDTGYTKGVPMGGDLTKAAAGKAPNFLIRAVKDPDGANLDRVQVIKGWMDKEGKLQERVYDVAVSGDRKIGKNGRCKTAVGNTVDVKNATFTNAIGEFELAVVWADPDFDPEERAFYYVRVIEIPTPRWTAYDAKRFGVEIDEKVPMTTQDRAYTSPIWYTPGS
jgi:hypothetical protein